MTWDGRNPARGPDGYLEQVGMAHVAIPGTNSATVTVTFPTPFASAPFVWAQLQANTPDYIVNVGDITSTQCTICLAMRDASSTVTTTASPVAWRAIGPA